MADLTIPPPGAQTRSQKRLQAVGNEVVRGYVSGISFRKSGASPVRI